MSGLALCGGILIAGLLLRIVTYGMNGIVTYSMDTWYRMKGR